MKNASHADGFDVGNGLRTTRQHGIGLIDKRLLQHPDADFRNWLLENYNVSDRAVGRKSNLKSN